VTGLFILLEGQYAVGEYVTLNGVFGQVAQITLRTTALDLPDGKRQYFPNGAINSVAVYPDPLVWYELLVPLASPEQAKELAEPLAALGKDLQANFPRRLVRLEAPEPYAAQEVAPGLRLPLAVRPGYEWIATEEAPGRVKALLETRNVAVPGGLQPVARAVKNPES
jgi:small conductance mechanosensitive channel